MKSRIHQEVVVDAEPSRVYAALTDGKQFSAMSSGAPAEIDATAGGAFSCFGGMILGRNLELAPGRRLVQAWRVKVWPEGEYSMVRFELHPEGRQTRVTMDHWGFPDDQGEHLDAGWHQNYWEPLRKHLS
jgi:activator of HSP90 ATPase